MTVVDPASGLSAPTVVPPSARRRPDPLTRLPRWVRFPLYLVVGVAILSLAREITGAGQLTAEGTFRSALQLSMPIALAGLGGLWAERAGVVNIGLEGMMVLGTWFGAYGAIAYGPWAGVAMGIVAGAVGGLLHAIATVSFGVDHIISGVAINLLGVGFTNFLTTTTTSWGNQTKESPQIPANVANVDLVPFLTSPLETLSGQNRFFVSDLSRILLALTTNVSLLVVLGVVLFPLTWYLLWKTRVGLRLRSAGEDPEAADSLGVRVYGVKYLAVMMSGAFSGLGGVTLVYLFAEKFQSGQTGGRGFIGLAAMIFGNWRPGGLILGAALFGFMDSMQSQVDSTAHALLVVASLLFVVLAVRQLVSRKWVSAGTFALLAGLFWFWYQQTDELPREMIPYFPHITTLLVLVFASQRLRMPAADGQVYRRSGR
jgi:ABC-type uncharacterized transport system permease subunit